MQLDPREMSTRDLYAKMVQVITPRPIAWVSTISSAGIANLAPFSFFTGVGAKPPTVLFCPANADDGQPKHTLRNVLQTGEFVVNIASYPLAEAMNQSSAQYPEDVNEFAELGLAAADSIKIKPPRVAESPVSLECTLHQAISLAAGPGGANIVIGKIVQWHIDDTLFESDGTISAERLDTVGRMGGQGFVRTTDRFEMTRPGPMSGRDG